MTLAFCGRCEAWSPVAILVQVVETGSGPGGMIYACPEHARLLATSPFAPQWLKDEIFGPAVYAAVQDVSHESGEPESR